MFKDIIMLGALICPDYVACCFLYMCRIWLLPVFMLSNLLFIRGGDDSALDSHVSWHTLSNCWSDVLACVSARSWLFVFYCIALVQGDLLETSYLIVLTSYKCSGHDFNCGLELLCGSVWLVVGIWWGLYWRSWFETVWLYRVLWIGLERGGLVLISWLLYQ